MQIFWKVMNIRGKKRKVEQTRWIGNTGGSP